MYPSSQDIRNNETTFRTEITEHTEKKAQIPDKYSTPDETPNFMRYFSILYLLIDKNELRALCALCATRSFATFIYGTTSPVLG
jgi:hypothetical protein